jgi:hypothetical protein
MSLLEQLLNWAPVSRVRRNHALEHATLQVLGRLNPRRPLAGYSDLNGFWILGNVSTEELQTAVDEALARLRAGERGLVIHPNCGTNFATAGLLAGSAAWLAMLGSGSSLRKKLERWPLVVLLVTFAIIAAQPLGLQFQARYTTQAEVGALQVTEIVRFRRGGAEMHRVSTRN